MKEFTFSVVSIAEDLVGIYSDSLDWEIQVPLDFFPDPHRVEIDDTFYLSVNKSGGNIHDGESGGYIKKEKPTKFKVRN